MHTENKLRAAQNLPLRTHYSPSELGVDPNTQFLDDKSRSLFYNTEGKFIFNRNIKKKIGANINLKMKLVWLG